MSIETDSIQNFPGNKLLKKCNNEINFICPKNKDPIHYYYTDPLNLQWCFTEIRGSAKDYYYRCSTSKCSGFGMISKTKTNAPFILTKSHSIPYYEHKYSLNKYAEINFDIPEKNFIKAFNKSKIFRISAIKNYVGHNDFVSLESTIEYFKGRGIKHEIDNYKNEIINAITSR